MRRILLSLLTIFTTTAMMAGASQAVFSDTDTFEGNNITTATVNIDARSEAHGLLPKPLIASGLIPGEYTDWARGVVYNEAGSTNVRVYMYVANRTGTACDKTNIEVYTGYAESAANVNLERDYQLYSGPLSGLAGEGKKVEITGFVFKSPNWLPANTSAVIQQRAQLDGTAGDGLQGATCTWDEVFVAQTPIVAT